MNNVIVVENKMFEVVENRQKKKLHLQERILGNTTHV
jgi:uncharacterized protein YggL (DUF469 family)